MGKMLSKVVSPTEKSVKKVELFKQYLDARILDPEAQMDVSIDFDVTLG